jgi:long-chain acyl-CoA synthetase
VTETTSVSRRRQLAGVGMGLAWHAEEAPDRLAIVSDAGERTYAELNARANRLIRALRRRGVRAGQSLGLVCANRPEFAETYGATHRGGLRLTPINWHLTAEEIAYILNDCEATAFVADARFAEACAEAARLASGVTVRLAVGGQIEGFDDYHDALATEPGDDIDDPVIGRTMLYTSGTTGRPKGVDRPPEPPTGASTTRDDGDRPPPAGTPVPRDRPLRAVPGDVHLLTGPAYHAAPLAISLLAPLASGITVVMMDHWEPEEALRLIERHRVTHSHLVPTMFHRLLALPDAVRARYDVSTLVHVLHGAAPCPVEVKRRMIEWWGPVIFEYYAATEGGGTSITPEEWLAKPGSVGRANPGRTVEVWGADGNPLPPGEVGTVYFKAPSVGRFRYHKDESKTAGAYQGDFFTLGDMGYFDDDGYLFLTGRSAEVIISGGVNIYPAEVDAVMLEHPAVADACTVGVPNDDWGEEVKTVIEPKGGIEASDELAAELIVHCRAHLAHYKCPRSIDFTDALPRQDSGKIYRRKVRDPYWEARDTAI